LVVVNAMLEAMPPVEQLLPHETIDYRRHVSM